MNEKVGDVLSPSTRLPDLHCTSAYRENTLEWGKDRLEELGKKVIDRSSLDWG